MSPRHSRWRCTLPIAAAAYIAACGEGPTESTRHTLTVAESALTLMIGESDTLGATLTRADGTVSSGTAITWRTLNATIAAVSTGGIVTGVGSGETRVIATAGTLADTVSVVVSSLITATGAVGPAGGAVTLPSGVTVAVLPTSAILATTLRLIESPPRGDSASADTSRRLVVTLPGASSANPVSVRVSWPTAPRLPDGQRMYLVAENDSGVIEFGAEVAGAGSTSQLRQPTGSGASEAVLGFYLLQLSSVRTTLRAILLAAQTPETCASSYQLRDTTSVDARDPDIAVVLVHGWQPFRYCGLPAVLAWPYEPFTGYQPLVETWPELVDDLLDDPVLAPRVRVYWYRYPTTLPPELNGQELLRRLEASPVLPHGVGTIILVGHSMGGLVARAADASDVHGRIGAIISLGTPHDGAGLSETNLANRLFPSEGLESLRPGAFSRSVPMPPRAPLHAIYGELPCGHRLPGTTSALFQSLYTAVSYVFCSSGGSTPAGRGWTDGVVSRSSATPYQAVSVFPSITGDLSDIFGDGLGHFELPENPAVRTQVLSTIRESLPADTLLTPLTRLTGSFGHHGIIAENGFIYGTAHAQYGNSASLTRIAVNGGSTASLTPMLWAMGPWLADSAWLYFTQAEGSSFPLRIKRVRREGGQIDSIGGGLTAYGPLAQDDHYLYFSDHPGTNYNLGFAIRRIPKSGGDAQTVVPALPNSPFAVRDGHLYYAEDGGGAIRRRRLADGHTITLSSAFEFPQGGGVRMLVSDGLVVLTKADTVFTLPSGGGAVVRRLTGVAATAPMWAREGRLFVSDTTRALISLSLSDFSRRVRRFPDAVAIGMDDRYFYLHRGVCCWAVDILKARR